MIIFITFLLFIFNSQTIQINQNSLLFDENYLQNWMQDPDVRNLSLNKLTLPGTHDSGSSVLTDDLLSQPTYIKYMIKIAKALKIPINQIIKSWAKTQTLDLYQQFKKGIRYADIRVCQFQKIWKVCHAAVVGRNLNVILNQAKQFLIDYQSEILILELSHINPHPNSRDLIKLNQMIYDIFGNLLLPRTYNLSITINEMVKLNKRLILTMTDTKQIKNFTQIWYGNTIINSYANSPDLKTMEQYNIQKVREFVLRKNYSNLYKLSYDLTPNALTILEMVLPNRPKSVLQLAEIANKSLLQWYTNLLHKGYEYPFLGNIFIIDYFQTSPVVQICLQQNFNTANQKYLKKLI